MSDTVLDLEDTTLKKIKFLSSRNLGGRYKETNNAYIHINNVMSCRQVL